MSNEQAGHARALWLAILYRSMQDVVHSDVNEDDVKEAMNFIFNNNNGWRDVREMICHFADVRVKDYQDRVREMMQNHAGEKLKRCYVRKR